MGVVTEWKIVGCIRLSKLKLKKRTCDFININFFNISHRNVWGGVNYRWL